MKVISAALALAAATPAAAPLGATGPERREAVGAPEAVFFNAKIYTMDGAMPVARALAVRGGRVLAAGREDEIRRMAGKETMLYDLGGATVVPGLVDAHAHFSGFALSRAWIDLVGTASREEIHGLLKTRAAQTGEGEWIRGRGWDQNDWEDGTLPTSRELDSVCSGNPVLLVRVCGHAAVANSAALRAAGIGSDTPDPEGGRIERDAQGVPTGILIDGAVDLVSGVIPEPTREEKKRLMNEAARACLERGLTGVTDMGIGAATASIYMEMSEAGELPLRVTAWYSYDDADIDSLLDAGPVRYHGEGHLEIPGVKFFMDGSLGARSAALIEDYSDDAGNRGLLVTRPEEMLPLIIRCAEKGFPAAIHAIGDRGNRTALDVLEKVIGATGRGELRHRIEHAQVLAPPDIPRFAELGVTPSMQFTHCTSDMPWAGDRLGEDRLEGAYVWRSLLSSGVRIPGGSDFPVESIDPLLGIYAAVTRRDTSGAPAGGWYPAQCLTVEEAVRAFTVDAAWAAGQEEQRGSLTPGRMADLTVLSMDLMELSGRDILDAEVVATVVGGIPVFVSQGSGITASVQ